MPRITLLLLLLAGLLAAVPVRGAEEPGFDFTYSGSSILDVAQLAARWSSLPHGSASSGQSGREPLLILSCADRKPLEASFPCPLDPDAEYLFRARVKSTDAVIFRLAGLSMCYNDLGQWQTVAGLCRINRGADSTLRLSLRPLGTHATTTAEISDVSLLKIQRPAKAPRRHYSGRTVLVRPGHATAAIIVPAGSEAYLEWARQISAAIQERSGTGLEIVTDVAATARDYPVLLTPWRSRPLILLGRLGNNRALWAAYNRSLTAVDGFYPGADGYAVHTAANVFNTGINHLVVGATTEAGMARAVQVFISQISAARINQGALELPWLHAIELRGECREVFRRDDARWRQVPESELLPKPEPGYGNVIRWYDNAMGYYLTGWDSYREREQAYRGRILGERATTHQYISEFMIRIYRMVDQSGLFSPEDVERFDALIAQNFLDCGTIADLSWMTTFAPPYGDIALVNRHQVSPWLADYEMSAFVSDTLVPTGGLQELANFRRQEKGRLFRDFVLHRSGPSLPGGVLEECYEEIPAAFFRFALEHELYAEFFGSGNARKALFLERINPQSGSFTFPAGRRDSKFVLGIVASLTADPELKWQWAHLPEVVSARGYFQSRYIGPAFRYNPDAAAPERVPSSSRHLYLAPLPVTNTSRQPPPAAYHFGAIIGGWRVTDDYLAYNGVNYTAPSGLIATLASGGVTWLGSNRSDARGGRFNDNTAYAIRADGTTSAIAFDDMSYCIASEDRPDGTTVRLRQLLSPDIIWERDITWSVGGHFEFRDRFTALRDGTYRLCVAWHPAGTLTRESERAFLFTTPAVSLNVKLAGQGFTATFEVASLTSPNSSLHLQAFQSLKKGETVSASTSLQISASSALPPHPGNAPSAEHSTGVSVRDLSAAWRLRWNYEGLLRPTRVTGRGQAGVVDFGAAVPLTEIRASSGGSPTWQTGRLPDLIELAVTAGDWRPADGKRAWRSGVRTGNYGETHPMPRTDETLRLAATPVRYLRTDPSAKLAFFAATPTASRHPVRLETGDFRGDGTIQTLAVASVFPQFPRDWRDDDVGVAFLDAKGKEIFQLNPDGPVQAVRLLPWKNTVAPQLFVVAASGLIEAYGLDGKLLGSVDLYRLHAEFDRQYNHRATRHPAGGFVLPFSIGTWRPEQSGERHLVIGRYGGFSFLNPDLSFEGVLGVSGYAVPGLLVEGADFTGRGIEEQVGAERMRLWALGGDSAPTVRDPSGLQSWPQVYDLLEAVNEDPAAQTPLAGPAIVRYELLPRLTARPRYVLMARGTSLSLYDGQTKSISSHWNPPAPINGVGIVVQAKGRLELLVATADSLLWDLCWTHGPDQPAELSAHEFPDTIATIREIPGKPGTALIAGAHGIYLAKSGDTSADRIAEGDFVDVWPQDVREGRLLSIVAATRRGEIQAFSCVSR
jgi:hypothetical protein